MGLARKKKGGKKGKVGESAKRVHKKVPGFDAFCVSSFLSKRILRVAGCEERMGENGVVLETDIEGMRG